MKGTPKQLIPYLVTLDDEKVYEVKEYKHKRSLDANAYYWVLVNKIANALRQSKEFIHLCMLKQYGVTYSLLIPSEANIEGLLKYYEKESNIVKNQRTYTVYKAYKPSSEMNTSEMAHLIDGVVDEAKELGIETMTPNELLSLKAQWGC